MPIAINGSGTVTGISAGGLPDGVITTNDIADSSVSSAKLGSNEQNGLCKAWVNFNGTGTVAIRASYNVSSITDGGTGLFTVNFTTALADANYSIATFSIGISAATTGTVSARDTFSPAAGSCPLIATRTDTGGASDLAHVHAAFFR